ncbi:MAG TPA: hypothetical protein VM144_04850 [Aestuariivirga sp.]|nr:hypothetical protein [Aestuariivirga sp.]
MATKKTAAPEDTSRQIQVVCREGEDPQLASARMLIGPHITNANVAAYFAKGQVGGMLPIAQLVNALNEASKCINSNEMKDVEATLNSQATALNIMFGELSRRAAVNMGTYLPTAEIYLRLALKAQNQCRMTLETLSNIKNPPVMYAKQANIAHGPQQVNNSTKSCAHVEENQNQPNKLLEQSNEIRMDGRTQDQTSNGNPAVEAVVEVNRSKIG